LDIQTIACYALLKERR